MKTKQITMCEIECSCGEAVFLRINEERPESYINCPKCDRSYIAKIMDTSLWTPSCVEYTIMIAEDD